MMASDELSESFNHVLTTSAQLGFGARTLPGFDVSKWPPVNGVRLSPLADWLVDSDNFEKALENAYTSVQPGTTRKLIAPTGVGKSTIAPATIARLNNVSVIVLVPQDRHVATIHEFTSRLFVSKGMTVVSEPLSSSVVTNPPGGNNVFYSTGTKLLSLLSRHPNLLELLRVDFIIVDEYHILVPANLALYVIVKVHKRFSNVRLLAATATGPSDISTVVKKQKLTAIKLPVNALKLEDPESNASDNPMHYSRITNRTMIFLPTDASIATWRQYYLNHDIPVVVYGFVSSSKQLKAVHAELESHPLIVLLATQVAETTFTFNIDTVIDTGSYLRVASDFTSGASLLTKHTTKSMREQRAGRVGRFKDGVSYYFDFPLTEETTQDDMDISFQVYLWMILFNVTMNDAQYSRFKALGTVSPLKAALLLHSKLPPFLLFPYVDNTGFFKGWEIMSKTLYTDVTMLPESFVSSKDNKQSVEDFWNDQICVHSSLNGVALPFKSRLTFPVEWNVVPAIAYQVFAGANENGVVSHLSTRSIGTAIEVKERPKSATIDKNLFNNNIVGGQRKTVGFGDFSDVPASKSQSTDDIKRARRKQVISTATISMAPPLPEAARIDFEKRQFSSAKKSRIDEWVADTSEAGPAMNTESARESLPGYDDQVVATSPKTNISFSLACIDPNDANYKYHTFYPMDPGLLERFMQTSQKVTMQDEHRIRRMINGSVVLNHLNITRLHSYFLTAIRVHNSQATKHLQLLAAKQAPTFIDKVIFGRFENTDTACKSMVIASCSVIRVFNNLHLAVGIDTRFRHANSVSSESQNGTDLDVYEQTPLYSTHEHAAMVNLMCGTQQCRDRVDEYSALHGPHLVLSVCVSNMWAIGTYIVAVRHSLLTDAQDNIIVKDTIVEDLSATIHSDMKSLDIVILSRSVEVGVPYVREPVAGEDAMLLYWNSACNGIVRLAGLNVVMDDDDTFITLSLHKGASGALVVSASDGALLGFYTGAIQSLGAFVKATSVLADLV